VPDSWTVPGYTRVRDLGTGRSGRVVLAVDDVTETPVAIKYVRGDAVALQRLEAEAGALSRIEDPNLVQVYEYTESPGLFAGAAVVTEFVDGVSLRRLLAAAGALAPEAALSVLSGSLLALAAVHDDAGITHRAFRPENLLIAADGTTKVSDTGIGDAGRYRAPEQTPGPAADLYAATAVFVECLAGAHAIPAPFRDLVAAGLAADPAARPRSAAEFLTELDEVASTAYGSAWERTGRGQLAQHAARATAYKSPAAEPDAEDWAPLADAPEAFPEPFPEAAEPAAPSAEPVAVATPAEPAPAEPAPAESVLAEPAPGAAAPPDAPPVERSPFGISPFGPSPFGDPREPAYDDDPGTRPARRWAAGGRLAIAAGIALIVAAGATWYVMIGRNPHNPAASAQAGVPTPTGRPGQPGPPGEPGGRQRPPTGAADLATTISATVAARRSATFVHRAAGVAAQGILTFNGRAASAYDMRVTPLTAGRLDRRHPVSQVILVGGNAFVAYGGWKPYPATPAAAGGRRPADPGRLYAALATETRWASSVNNILALLAASTKLRRTGLTYRGVAGLSRLTREPAVAALYPRAPRRAVVMFTIEMAQNLLPRQLTVTIKVPGARHVFRTTYTGWGQRAAITPPR
jgi:serine/threonine-protein kinase